MLRCHSGVFANVSHRDRRGTGANRLGESVKVFSLTIWWPVVSKRKGLEGMFDGWHFDGEIIILCVRWYLRYKLNLRDLVETMAERELSLAHTTMRWVIRFTPEFVKRWNRLGIPTGRSWRVDETYLKIRGKWVICTGWWIEPARRWTSCSGQSAT
jgi:hypothetical protein